tara:strand:- start:1607 stop:1831 length:225 start_codon:yes stop_codon:yes gene_type:complete
MKGITYNLIFTTPSQEKIIFNNLSITDMMKTIETTIKQEYKFEMKITRNMIYNLVHRPLKSNRVVRQFCNITIS